MYASTAVRQKNGMPVASTRTQRRLRSVSHALCSSSFGPAGSPTCGNLSVDAFADLRGKAVAPLQGSVDGPFSDDDLLFWAENGYVVLEDAVPEELTQAVVDDIFSFFSYIWKKHIQGTQRTHRELFGVFRGIWGYLQAHTSPVLALTLQKLAGFPQL